MTQHLKSIVKQNLLKKLRMANTLWEQIKNAEAPLAKFIKGGRQTACIYPKPYDKAEIVRWFYSRNNRCQVFFVCSEKVSEIIENDGWSEVSPDFTAWVEEVLMSFCVENTDWIKCPRYGIDYDKKLSKKKAEEAGCDTGCAGTICYCEPFGTADYTYGVAEEDEFDLTPRNRNQPQ